MQTAATTQTFIVIARLYQSYATGYPTMKRNRFNLGTFTDPVAATRFIAEYLTHNDLVADETIGIEVS